MRRHNLFECYSLSNVPREEKGVRERRAMQVIGAPQQLPFRSSRDAVTVRRDCTIGRVDGTSVYVLIVVPL